MKKTQQLVRAERLWTLKENLMQLVWLGNCPCLLFNYVQNKFVLYLIFGSIKSVLSGKRQTILKDSWWAYWQRLKLYFYNCTPRRFAQCLGCCSRTEDQRALCYLESFIALLSFTASFFNLRPRNIWVVTKVMSFPERVPGQVCNSSYKWEPCAFAIWEVLGQATGAVNPQNFSDSCPIEVSCIHLLLTTTTPNYQASPGSSWIIM